jgi:hypothetical protein
MDALARQLKNIRFNTGTMKFKLTINSNTIVESWKIRYIKASTENKITITKMKDSFLTNGYTILTTTLFNE